MNRFKLALKALAGKPLAGNFSRYPDFDTSPISEKDLEEIKLFFPLDKFFIFGHARSGTTLLVRLIRLHPEVHCNYQGHFFTRPPLLESMVADPQIQSWLTRNSNRWNRGTNISSVMLRSAADFILEREARHLGKSIVGDKSPNSLLNGRSVELAHRIYPDAKLIFIVRDGRDAAISHRFQSFIDSTQHLSRTDWRIREDFVADPQLFITGQRSLFSGQELKKSARNWIENVNQTSTIGRTLYGADFATVRYEDMLVDPLLSIRTLWEFLGADASLPGLDNRIKEEMSRNPDADWQMEKAIQVAGPLQKGKKGSWKNFFTDQDKEVFNEFAGDTLRDWGYSV
jgi:hypothetical protein